MDAATRDRIRQDYPAFAYLLDDPEVAPLLEQAVTEGWGEQMFISKLWATNWWRTRTEAQRQMSTLAQLDPAQYQRIVNERTSQIQELSNQLGIVFSQPELIYIGTNWAQEGTSSQDPWAMHGVLDWVRAHPDRINSKGSIYANAQAADAMARSEFFYAPSWNDAVQFGIDAAFGYNNLDGLRGAYADWFAALNPHLAPRLQGGETLAQIVNPLRDIVAKELELGGLESVDMISNNQWKWLLGMPDPSSGAVRLPTSQEVLSAARKDPRWRATMGGTALATDLVAGITERMGVRA